MLDMTTGKLGDLVAMGDRQVKFALDEADRGKVLRWYDPGFDRAAGRRWTPTKPYYLQVPGAFSKRASLPAGTCGTSST